MSIPLSDLWNEYRSEKLAEYIEHTLLFDSDFLLNELWIKEAIDKSMDFVKKVVEAKIKSYRTRELSDDEMFMVQYLSGNNPGKAVILAASMIRVSPGTPMYGIELKERAKDIAETFKDYRKAAVVDRTKHYEALWEEITSKE